MMHQYYSNSKHLLGILLQIIKTYKDLVRAEKTVEHESDTNHRNSNWNSPQEFGKETGEIGDHRKNHDYPNHSTAKIS